MSASSAARPRQVKLRCDTHVTFRSPIASLFLGLLWGLTSISALLLPVGILKWNRKLLMAAAMGWRVAGVLLVLFSAMNYFTHIGLLMNTSDSF